MNYGQYSLSSAIALALLWSLLACPQVRSQTAEGSSLEVVNYRLRPGTNSLGLPLQRPAWWRGQIASVSAATRTLVDQDAKNAGPILGQLPLEAAYLEITSSPLDPTLVGERFEVGVLETRGPAGAAGQVRLRSTPWDTRPDLPPGLAGCTYQIHPHWTLGSFLGTPDKAPLRKGRTAAGAELVRLPALDDPAKWETFFVLEDRGGSGWRNALHRGGPDMAARILPPGVGVQVILAAGSERPLVLLGEARRHPFRRPLRVGRNLVALGHPGPRSLQSILAHRDYGFQAGGAAGAADEIHFQAHGRWEILRYESTPGSLRTPRWRCLTARYGGALEDLPLLPPQHSFWILKVQPDSDFIVPPPAP